MQLSYFMLVEDFGGFFLFVCLFSNLTGRGGGKLLLTSGYLKFTDCSEGETKNTLVLFLSNDYFALN